MKKALIGCLISLTAIAITLVIVEAAYRIFEAKQSGRRQWTDRPRYYFQHSEAPTLKDYPYNPVKQPDTFRVAVVGDSFTFAPYMQFTDAFPKILERMLRLNGGAPVAEVINYGVPGYSTTHEVETTEQALKEGADLILLQITLNDPELKPYRPIGIREFHRFGAYKPAPWEERLFRYWHSGRFVRERLHNTKTEREYVNYFFDLFDNRKTREPFKRAMKDIVEKAKNSNTPIAAVLFPLFGTPLDERYPFHELHARVRKLMEDLDVPLLDLYPLYEGIPLERMQVIPGGDRHPNEIAHRMAAERIYDWLLEENFIPAALQIQKRFKGRTQIIKETPFTDP